MRSGRLAALLVVGLLTGGCAADVPETTTTPPEEGVESRFLIDRDFPDPEVLAVDDGYLALATNSPAANVQVATSPDLVAWTVQPGDALPSLPDWAAKGRTWAPTVFQRDDDVFVLYFTAEHRESGRQCIGAATSTSAAGPYLPVGEGPAVCTLETGGAIDPSTFVDGDGVRYLLWKDDGNCCGLDTWIRIAPLSPDGLSLAGPATPLIKQTEDWEGALVEAPTLVERDGTYALLYSANDYGSEAYAIGVATADSLLGPYVKRSTPLLSTATSGLLGPGGQTVVTKGDEDVLVFHAWDSLFMYRGITSLPLVWTDGMPEVDTSG